MATAHTVGIFDAREHVPFHAANTAVLVAAITLDLLTEAGRVGFCTNGTALHLHNFVLSFLGRHFASRLDRNAIGSNLRSASQRRK